MKKKLLIIILVLLLIACILFAFIKSNSKSEFVIKNIYEEIKNDDEILLMQIDYDYIEFTSNNNFFKNLNSKIKKEADDNVLGFKFFKDMAENQVGTDLETSLPYVYENTAKVIYNKGNIVVTEDISYEEMGGPHPNYWVEYHNYDVKHEKELKLSDIYPNKTSEELSNLIIEKLKSTYENYEEDMKDRIEGEITPLKNNIDKIQFAIENDGVLMNLEYFVPHGTGECVVKLPR